MGKNKGPTKLKQAAEAYLASQVPDSRALQARLQALQTENERLSGLLGLVESYKTAAIHAPRWALPDRGKRKFHESAAIACMHLSDLHLDEVVNPAEIGGLNSYNRKIAEIRLRSWAERACEMGDRHKHKWQGAFVFLGGDMVSGAIHEELRETNEALLPETVVYWAPRIASALKTVADFYGHLKVPAVVGNHGRLRIRMPAKRRGRDSWDWVLYQMVMAHLSQEKHIEFDIASGSYLFVEIYPNKPRIFLTHGDEVGGGGGWAGVWSPLGTIYKRAVTMAAAHKYQIDYAVIGHWHQCVLAHQAGLCGSGALKGWDEYAAAMRFQPELASQNWWVVTPEHPTTLAAPLFLQNRKAEGW